MAVLTTRPRAVAVAISGIEGKHPIRVGVAYWYRGHYLYGPHGNPIEAVPFATKEIHIVGTTPDTAPPYNSQDPALEDERKIAALHSSMLHEWDNMQQAKDNIAEPPVEAFASQTEIVDSLTPKKIAAEHAGKNDHMLRFTTHVAIIGRITANSFCPPSTSSANTDNRSDTQLAPFANASSQAGSSGSTYTAPTFNNFYNARAMFLAASAPVSEHGTPRDSNTPYPSRPVSPSHQQAAGIAMTVGNRSDVPMSRVDKNVIQRRMVDHGINRSVATLKQAAPCMSASVRTTTFDGDTEADIYEGLLKENVQGAPTLTGGDRSVDRAIATLKETAPCESTLIPTNHSNMRRRS
jgi:hypothetical protein